MKQQKVERPKSAKRPVVIDRQTAPEGVEMRTVVFVEIGGATPQQFAELSAKFAAEYEGSPMGHHYFVPVRDGKIMNDPLFEEEFLKVVLETCEVKDGQIVLKDGATPVKVVRNFVE